MKFVNIFDDYKKRKNNKDEYVMDLKTIKELGGDQGILSILQTSLDAGIKSDTRPQRVQEFGTNEPEITPRTTFWELMCDVLQDFMLQLLIVCAIFALVTEMIMADEDHKAYAWIEGTSILLAVSFVTVFTAASDYNKETQFIEN
jgi:magnesium-transporting ATPase (P-type)